MYWKHHHRPNERTAERIRTSMRPITLKKTHIHKNAFAPSLSLDLSIAKFVFVVVVVAADVFESIYVKYRENLSFCKATALTEPMINSNSVRFSAQLCDTSERECVWFVGNAIRYWNEKRHTGNNQINETAVAMCLQTHSQMYTTHTHRKPKNSYTLRSWIICPLTAGKYDDISVQ